MRTTGTSSRSGSMAASGCCRSTGASPRPAPCTGSPCAPTEATGPDMPRHEHDPAAVFDLAVIGAGPCGLAAGIAARRAGLSCILFDAGCVASSIAQYPVWMTFFSTADRLEIGGVPFVVAGDRPTRREALRYYQRLAREYALDVHQYEPVLTATGARGEFTVHTRDLHARERAYRGRNLVVATGYFDSPNLLGIPGEQLPSVAHGYREAHAYYDQDVLIVGGGNSAVDAALELYRWGARVTIVHFLPELDPNVKPWVRPELEAR
ncbi:MAG: FAD-binding protein, partial [Gemmatimonadetes bacterium]|nr:FAD-binding protein [Gemmatimonadota bacterium]